MKKWLFFAALALSINTAGAQSPSADDLKRLDVLIKLVHTQQIQIAQNQALIDQKLAAVAETIRIARIYASRGRR